MEYQLSSKHPKELSSDCLILPVFAGGELLPPAKSVDEDSSEKLLDIINSGDMEGKKGQTLLLHNVAGVSSKRVLLVGAGELEKFDADAFRAVAASAATQLNKTASTSAVFALEGLNVANQDIAWKLRHVAEIFENSRYTFQKMKSAPEETRHPLTEVIFCFPQEGDQKINTHALQQGHAVAMGAALAKDLGNMPGNICTPTYLAEQAVALADTYGMKAEVLEESDMESLGMGALLSVSRGSRQPAKLIIVSYQGGKKNDAPVVLVGKGLTFDAGGISIKPAANMDEMKYDMCGGASVLGTLKAIGELKLPINVIGVIPSSENLPDGEANKPGDVVTSMSGQTIEILNTDAEGRLILCDALTYSERFKPAVVIDIATLTGAVVVALGAHATGLMGNDDALAEDLLAAGNYTCDRAWRLPIWEQYQGQLDSNFADMANIGGRQAGAITAACFLSRYTKDYKWAHLDIAGTAWKSGKAKGATGRPVALLTQFLVHRAQTS
ncbi:MAG: leucyl aminopeptidase [Acidiferrobacterales bacterium]